MKRPEMIELVAVYNDQGDEAISAVCTLCGGALTRTTNKTGWNLWDLIDAMAHHEAGNHPAGPPVKPARRVDRLLPNLRSAREKLCVAQTDMEWPSHRTAIGEAITTIDRVGVWYCGADWSNYNLPTTEEPTS